MIIFGMLVVYFVNWGIVNGEILKWINDVGWRYMFVLGVILVLFFVVFLFLVFEMFCYLVI